MATRRYVHLCLPIICVVPMLALGGCEKAMQDMYNQPKYKPLGASALWPDGRASRPDVANTIAYSGAQSPARRAGASARCRRRSTTRRRIRWTTTAASRRT